MKKVPWGILAGAFAMLASFVTIGIIALVVVSNLMIASVGGDDGLLTNWWVYLLYALDPVALAGFGVGLFFYLRKKKIYLNGSERSER